MSNPVTPESIVTWQDDIASLRDKTTDKLNRSLAILRAAPPGTASGFNAFVAYEIGNRESADRALDLMIDSVQETIAIARTLGMRPVDIREWTSSIFRDTEGNRHPAFNMHVTMVLADDATYSDMVLRECADKARERLASEH